MHIHLRRFSKLGLSLGTVVVATTLFLAFRADSSSRYDAARARLEADCARWRAGGGTAWVCNPEARGQSLVPLLERGKAGAASASRALSSGDLAAAERALGEALDVTKELDRRGDLVGAVMAARVVDDVLAVIERDVPRTERGRALVARVLAGRRLTSVAHPLRGHLLSASRGVLDLFDRPFLRAVAVKVLEEEESVTQDMERAVARGDTEGCIRADQGRSYLTKRYAGSGYPFTCARLVEVAQSAKRLDRARNVALRRAYSQSTVR